jgi:RNA polymerase sigma-70 factor (ECF subfamily)
MIRTGRPAAKPRSRFGSAIVIGLAKVSQSRGSSPALPEGDGARLVLVPSDASPGEVLYERVAPVVNRMVWMYLSTDPERDDIAQDIFVKIVRSSGSVRDPAQLEAWAARVCFNTICNVFRRRKLLRWLSLDALEGYEPPDRDTDFEGRELVLRAQRILEHLPIAERMPFTLQLLGNASVEEMAQLSSCSVRSIRRRLKAARARFQRLVRRDPVLASRLTDGNAPSNVHEKPSDAREESSDG